MSLNQEQLNCVKTWVASGAGIGDVQTKLKEDFGVVMTYMDVRFLIDDLGAELVSKPEPVEIPNPQEIGQEIQEPQSMGAEDVADMPEEDIPVAESVDSQTGESEQSGAPSNVKVSVSPIQRPDCIISGDVEFSDGSKAEWRIDRMGQLGIIPQNPTMNPPQSEIMEFQRQLQQLLR